jgi:hypothetical protein
LVRPSLLPSFSCDGRGRLPARDCRPASQIGPRGVRFSPCSSAQSTSGSRTDCRVSMCQINATRLIDAIQNLLVGSIARHVPKRHQVRGVGARTNAGCSSTHWANCWVRRRCAHFCGDLPPHNGE